MYSTADTIKTRRNRKAVPIPGLKLPLHSQIEAWTHFSRAQIAQILGGIHPSMITRYAEVFDDIPKFLPIPREQIWNFYVFRCWKMHNPNGWRDSFLKELEEMGQEAFLKKYVYSAGGSREHCEELIDDFIAQQSTKKLIA